jgi:hypothetical protein
MKFKVFNELKDAVSLGKVHEDHTINNIDIAITYLLESNSPSSLRLFTAIFCLYQVNRTNTKEFFPIHISNKLQCEFAKDPSSFSTVVLCALSKYGQGDLKRAEQLLTRVVMSGWKEKNIAENIKNKLFENRVIHG